MRYNTSDPLLIFFLTLGYGKPLQPDDLNISYLLAYRSFTLTKLMGDLNVRPKDYPKMIPFLTIFNNQYNDMNYESKTGLIDSISVKTLNTSNIENMPRDLQILVLKGQEVFSNALKLNPENAAMHDDILAVAKKSLEDPDLSDDARKALESILDKL